MRTQGSNTTTFPCPDFWNGPSHPAKTRIWIYVNSQNPQACSTTLSKAGLTPHSQKPLRSSTFWFWRCTILLVRVPHRVLTHSLDADCVLTLKAAVCCSLLKHSLSGKPQGKYLRKIPAVPLNSKPPASRHLCPVTPSTLRQRLDLCKDPFSFLPTSTTAWKPCYKHHLLQPQVLNLLWSAESYNVLLVGVTEIVLRSHADAGWEFNYTEQKKLTPQLSFSSTFPWKGLKL